MSIIRIPKRSGGYRTVMVPSPERKQSCRRLLPALHRLVRQLCDLDVVHGFAELRSPVTNAAKHVGYESTLSLDLADFFDSVDSCRIRSWLPADCFVGTCPMQGLPTSPLVANIAAAGMDSEISQACQAPAALVAFGVHGTIAYTRYADDLTLSWSGGDSATAPRLTEFVTRAAANSGFAVNPRKTRLQTARYGRRVVTGVAVDSDGIYPTRALKRKIRAAAHNLRTGKVDRFPQKQWMRYAKTRRHHGRKPMPKAAWLKQWLESRLRGLEEWAALKPPAVGKRTATRIAASMDATDALTEIASRQQLLRGNDPPTEANP